MFTFIYIRFFLFIPKLARVEEELGANTNAKLTNQMFVPAATSINNNNNNINCNSNITNNIIHHSEGPDSINATYISVVSTTF